MEYWPVSQLGKVKALSSHVISRLRKYFPITTISVYVFTGGDVYLGISGTTDDQGQVSFDLSDGEYKVRADYLGYQFWSDELVWTNTPVTIENGIAQIHVHRSGSPIIGARVYLFKGSGGYLGHYADTDDGGYAEFELPDRQYKFRVDWEGSQYWTDPVTIVPHQVNEIDMDLDLMGLNLTRGRLYANNKPKNVLSALVGFPYRFLVSSVIAAPGVSETIYYYHNDHLGTPQVLTDDQGQTVWKGDYRPFGEVDITVETVRNDFRFPGQYFDEETGLHYNYHRYYHHDIGRYLRFDPSLQPSGNDFPFLLDSYFNTPQFLNPYSYVGNNPVNFTDPLGLGISVVCDGLRATCVNQCSECCYPGSDKEQMCHAWCYGAGFRSCMDSKGPGKYPENPYCKDKDDKVKVGCQDNNER